jgi:hypothetical protein
MTPAELVEIEARSESSRDDISSLIAEVRRLRTIIERCIEAIDALEDAACLGEPADDEKESAEALGEAVLDDALAALGPAEPTRSWRKPKNDA